MKNFIALFTVFVGLASFAATEIQLFGQCGGENYEGDKNCVSGTGCTAINKHYSQCLSTLKIRDATPTDGGFAAFGNTNGGAGGPTVRVSTLAALKSAVSGSSPKTVILTKSLTGKESVKIGPNTTLLGASGVTLNGIGLSIRGVSNVIVRNLTIRKVLATSGDAIAVQSAHKVWIDHVDLSSDKDHGKDYYDGLLDITHGCTYVTVSWSKLHDHYKASLVGHADDNGAEDKAITVTFHHNYFNNLNSRGPSFRFGTGHVYNNYYDHDASGIDTRDGAQLLVENNVFVDCHNPLFSTDGGFAVVKGNDFGGAPNNAPKGTYDTPPYKYSLYSLDDVKSLVPSQAGATLSY